MAAVALKTRYPVPDHRASNASVLSNMRRECQVAPVGAGRKRIREGVLWSGLAYRLRTSCLSTKRPLHLGLAGRGSASCQVKRGALWPGLACWGRLEAAHEGRKESPHGL